jgi:ribose transport system substrate-binding protein
MRRTSKIGALSLRSAVPRREGASAQRRTNRTIGALGVLVAAFALVASTSTAAESATPLNVTFVSALINDSYFVTIKCGAMAEAKTLGINLTWTGPTSNSVSAELSAFQAASVTNPNGMILAPFSNTGWSGVIKPLMQKGVPVVLSGETITPPDGLTTFISNFLAGGNSLATEIGKLTGGKGTMAIVADTTGNKTDSDRYTGLIPILKKRYPNLKIVGPYYAQNSTSMAASVTSSIILAQPNLSLVYASSGPEAVGSASAIAAAHKSTTVKLISFDSSPPQITLLQQGKLAATIGQSPYLTGELDVKADVAYLRQHGVGKGPVPASAGLSYTPTVLLTPQNVNSALGKKYEYLTHC